MFPYKIDADLELRLLDQNDAESMLALIERNRAHLDQWLRWSGRIHSLEDVKTWIERFQKRFAESNGFHAAIWYQGQLAGGIVCHGINRDSDKSEIGYWLGAEFVGKGLVTRACEAVLAYLFDEQELNRVEIVCGVENVRSRAIPERFGFTQEGILRESEWVTTRYVDHVMYSLLAEEWKARKK